MINKWTNRPTDRRIIKCGRACFWHRDWGYFPLAGDGKLSGRRTAKWAQRRIYIKPNRNTHIHAVMHTHTSTRAHLSSKSAPLDSKWERSWTAKGVRGGDDQRKRKSINKLIERHSAAPEHPHSACTRAVYAHTLSSTHSHKILPSTSYCKHINLRLDMHAGWGWCAP